MTKPHKNLRTLNNNLKYRILNSRKGQYGIRYEVMVYKNGKQMKLKSPFKSESELIIVINAPNISELEKQLRIRAKMHKSEKVKKKLLKTDEVKSYFSEAKAEGKELAREAVEELGKEADEDEYNEYSSEIDLNDAWQTARDIAGYDGTDDPESDEFYNAEEIWNKYEEVLYESYNKEIKKLTTKSGFDELIEEALEELEDEE